MLLRNAVWHLSGSALPAVVALATVPFLIQGLGLEGFGILTLIGSVMGYFGVLDINLSTGSIKYLAQFHAQKDQPRFSETFWFGWFFYGLLGLSGGLLLYLFANRLILAFFTISPALHADTVTAMQLAALGFVLTQTQNYLLVVPQALQRYDRSAQAEAFFGIAVNLVSAAVAMAGGGIHGVIAARVAVSAINGLWLVWLVQHLGVSLRPCWPRKDIRGLLMSFSAYAYLSRLAAMLQLHGDKLIVGALAGPVALAFYTVPAQLASRILGLCFRLSSVIYPRVSALAAIGQETELRLLYLDATRLFTYLNLMVLGVIALAGEEFLQHWVGVAFVASGYPVLLLMTLGLMADSLTNIPSLVNDGLGHPRVTGRFALARGLIGVALVYAGTLWAGIIGAAAAHALASVLMTALFLLYVHGRTVPITFNDTLRQSWLPSLFIGVAAFVLLLPIKWLLQEHQAGTLGSLLFIGLALCALLAAGLLFIINSGERAALFAAARRWYPGKA
jgi:O-antigen/teichoic acid export membrane protein